MFRPAARSLLRSTQSSLAPARTLPTRRFVSTQPTTKRSRSWQNSALRWGLAIAGIYYYNTSPVFAEQPHDGLLNPNVDAPALDDHAGPSLDVLAARRQEKLTRIQDSVADALPMEDRQASTSTSTSADRSVAAAPEPGVPTTSDGPQEAGEEGNAEGGAFNPETGEINWDCPCLGGMAHGPCGPEFRLAFSCFVFSEEEPKGMDCIEKFQGMRDCFQRYPEVYKDELAEDEELDRELEQEKQELVQQIKERREREREEELASPRLLEEPAPAAAAVSTTTPRVKVTRKVSPEPPTSDSTPKTEATGLQVDSDAGDKKA
ncbi:hypothetical protein DV738_g3070, partial [Chaetothyriales sp. CBS 135597]